GESTSVRLARIVGNSARRKFSPCRTANSTLQQEGADLIDDAGAPTDRSLAHPMQRLKVELLGGLGRDELHRRALHRFRDRLGIAIVVLFTFAIFRRHQPGVMAKRLKVATEMMRADAGFHPDQAWPYIGEPRFDLAARPLLPQHDAASPILADEVERILADIDPDYGDFAIEFLGHGLLLCLRCPGQLASAGRVGALILARRDGTSSCRDRSRLRQFRYYSKFRGHGVLLCLRCPGPACFGWQSVGARPDHPISGHRPAFDVE